MDKYQDLVNSMEDFGMFFNNVIPVKGGRIISANKSELEYIPDHNIFILNQKKEKGKFLYQDFTKRYFFDVIKVPALFKKYMEPTLVKDYDEEKQISKFGFDTASSISKIVRFVVFGSVKHLGIIDKQLKNIKDYNDLYDIFASTIDYSIDKLNEFMNNSKDEEVLTVSCGLIKWYKKEKYHQDFNTIMIRSVDDYKDTIDEIIVTLNELKDFIIRCKNIQDQLIFDEAKIKEFKNCFNIHELYLIMSKCIMENVKTFKGAMDLSEASSYVNGIDYFKYTDYNPVINIYSEESKSKKNSRGIIQYSFKKLKTEVKGYIAEHPEFQMAEVSLEELQENNLIGDADKTEKYITMRITQEQLNELSSDWDIIRAGEKDDLGATHRFPTGGSKGGSTPTVSSFSRYSFFTDSGYSYMIRGINKFDGYEGYIYPNGIVVFEVINDKKNNATYIMNIDNFIELSKLTKTELLDHINSSSSNDVVRKYHGKKWEANMKKIINGNGYTDDIDKRIQEIISEGKLKQDKKEKKNV